MHYFVVIVKHEVDQKFMENYDLSKFSEYA